MSCVYTRIELCIHQSFLVYTQHHHRLPTLTPSLGSCLATGCRRPYNPDGGPGFCNVRNQKDCFMPSDFNCVCRKNAKGEVLKRESSAIVQREPCVCPADVFEAAVLTEKEARKLVKDQVKAEAAAARMDTTLDGLLSDEQAVEMSLASEGASEVIGVKSRLDLGMETWLMERSDTFLRAGALRGEDPDKISSDNEAQSALAKRIYYTTLRSMQRLTPEILWVALDVGISSHVCSLVG